MNEGLITCPGCGKSFEISDVLTGKIREQLRAELQQDILRRETELNGKLTKLNEREEAVKKSLQAVNEQVDAQVKERLAEAEQRAAKKLAGQYTEQLTDLQETLEEREKSLKEFRDQERELRKKQQDLELAREAMDLEVGRKLDAERQRIQQEAAKKIESHYADQLKALNEDLQARETKIREFREKELELRREKQALEEAREAAELEISRTLDEERAKIRAEAANKAADEHRLKDLEKDKVINDLKNSLEDMKRRAEQGSMELQGEVLELSFEAQLRSFFPHDQIQPVPKGIRGADLIQIVCTPMGVECGRLLWETKNTKAWGAQWISKLKDDMIEARAGIAILVSAVIPEGLGRFGQMDGVWVSDVLSAIPLASVLREQVIAVTRERAASTGKNEKMEALYQYLAGTEFKQKIEGIVEAFTSMQDQLNQERRVFEKHWNQREKQIRRVIKNTSGLYGDMQGIIGGHIPSIAALELDSRVPPSLPSISVTDLDEDDDSAETIED